MTRVEDCMGREIQTLHETKYLKLVSAGKWQWVSRPNPVVCIAGLTDDGKVLLIEQFRTPVDARVIELPAGLVGDEPGSASEPLVEAARRELLEETGFEAEELTQAFVGVTSAGLTDETTTFFIASGLRQINKATGSGDEQIEQHLVPLNEVFAWLASRQRDGRLVDGRVIAGLYLLSHARQC
jgi:ADP-ribose pyrophosphatase